MPSFVLSWQPVTESVVLQVILTDKGTKEETNFKFDRWMARDQDDSDLVRELPVTAEGKEPLPGL